MKQMLILAGDHLYRMDYRDLVRFHRDTGADITLSLVPVNREEASRMGLVRVDGSGEVVEMVEKPGDPETMERFRVPAGYGEAHGLGREDECYLGSMGIYVFEPRVLVDALAHTDCKDFAKRLIPEAVGRKRLMGYPFSGYWKDIGTIPAFYEANLSLTLPDPPFHLFY